ncbi:MAG TPA: hypothetical protein VG253_21780 [Streptosporangiaceae bacterium]|nr:hypothetical protein [Streptosporangiaceae bacterium]
MTAFSTTPSPHTGALPLVSSLFAAIHGANPIQHLLALNSALSCLPAPARQTLAGREFFPDLISGPFHHGLVVVFAAGAALAVLAAAASLLRGGRSIHPAGTGQPPHSTIGPAAAAAAPPADTALPAENLGHREDGWERSAAGRRPRG